MSVTFQTKNPSAPKDTTTQTPQEQISELCGKHGVELPPSAIQNLDDEFLKGVIASFGKVLST